MNLFIQILLASYIGALAALCTLAVPFGLILKHKIENSAAGAFL